MIALAILLAPTTTPTMTDRPKRNPTSVRVMKTDAIGFHSLVGEADAVILEFSRDGVEAGLIGDALDRLMLLTDSKEYVERFTSRVMFMFDGYNSDPREIYQIPECVKFFGELTQRWPYWFHFIKKDYGTVYLLLLMQIAARSQRRMAAGSAGGEGSGGIWGVGHAGGKTFVELDPIDLGAVLQEGFDGMNSLHDHMGVPGAINQLLSEQIGRAVDEALGLGQ